MIAGDPPVVVDVAVLAKAIVVVNAATLIVVMSVGFRVVRALARFELRIGMMWADYKHRFGMTQPD